MFAGIPRQFLKKPNISWSFCLKFVKSTDYSIGQLIVKSTKFVKSTLNWSSELHGRSMNRIAANQFLYHKLVDDH